MDMKTISIATALLFIGTASLANASELRYTPTNPAFGGFPTNGSYFLQNAQAQNQHKETTDRNSSSQNFAQTITSSLLNRIAFNIADQIYGENAQDSGRFVIDDTLLEFNRVNNQVVVNITNSTTGEKTTIELPVTNF
jgi:curli production assembly/transport component CsgF